MALRDLTEQKIKDNMAGYLSGFGKIASGPTGAPTNVSWPGGAFGMPSRENIPGMNMDERSLYAVAWLAALHDAVLELADEVESQLQKPR